MTTPTADDLSMDWPEPKPETQQEGAIDDEADRDMDDED